jgi:DNA repair exonuclease SbcCD nuclease subunit
MLTMNTVQRIPRPQKVLIFSDLHLHPWTYGSTLDDRGRNTRLHGQLSFLHYIAKYVSDNDIDTVIFGGDLFHTHGKLDLEALNAALDGLTSIHCPHKFALIGNHDFKDKKGLINISKLWDRCNWVPISPRECRSWGGFGFVSYQEDNDNFLKEISVLKNTIDVKYIFTHQGVQGVKVGSGFEVPNEVLSPGLIREDQRLFTGHYHRHQVVAPNLTVIGSPMQHTWGDKGEDRGFIVLDPEYDKWMFRAYEYAPKFIEVEAGEEVEIGRNFYRVKGKPDPEYNQRLKEQGALLVESTLEEVEDVEFQTDESDFHALSDIIEEYERQLKLDEATIQVGRDLRADP